MEGDMGNEALAFAYNWIGENINANVQVSEGDTSQAEIFVSKLLLDASESGISRDQLEDAVGDLVMFVSNAMANATEEEVNRLIDGDE
jgi:hypothetical protein